MFEEAKYQNAAAKALQFIKAQLDVNHFDHDIVWGAEYSDYYAGDVMWGKVTGLTGSEAQVSPRYIATDQFYGYDFEGQVAGTWQDVADYTDAGVKVLVFRDIGYEVMVCPLESDGTWLSYKHYKEVYHSASGDRVVYYDLPYEVGEGVKEFRLGYGLSSEWTLISSSESMDAYRLDYSLAREETAANGGYAYGYLTDYTVKAYAYSDSEYLCAECKVWNEGSGGYIWFTTNVTEGHKIAKLSYNYTEGGEARYEIKGIAGATGNIQSGRLPASFLIPTDDPQYDKDGTRAQRVYGYMLNSRTWAYDIGLALLVFTTSSDFTICREILNRMVYEQNYDGSFNFSYDIYIGQLFEGYVRTGAMGWLVWGACYYELVTGDTTYNEMIEKAGDFLISRQVTDTSDPRYGLLDGGYGSYDFDDYSYIEGDVDWCSVEHQCSALQALEGCSLVIKDKKYKEAAELIKDKLYLKCYDKTNGRFYQGISAAPDPAWALDCTTWAGATVFSMLNLETARRCMQTAKQVFLTQEKKIVASRDTNYYNTRYQSFDSFNGFKPYSDKTSDYEGAPDIVWTEGSLGFVLLSLILGNETDAKTYMDECIKLQDIKNGSGGVLYVTGTYAMLPWEFHVWESVVSSAWLYLLVKNPSVLFPRTLRQVYYMAKIGNISDER